MPNNTNNSGWLLALRFAAREWRAGVRGWRIFLLCLFLGVAALSGLTSLVASIDSGLQSSAKTILGGDLRISSRQRSLNQEELARVQALAENMTSALELRVNLFSPSQAAPILAELKAVDAYYPLDAVFEPRGALATLDKLQNNAWPLLAEQQLLDRYQLKVGDSLSIGDASFTLTGVIERESDGQLSGFRLGPRVLISQAALDKTGLILPGSRINYRHVITLASGTSLSAARDQVKQSVEKDVFRITDTDNPSPRTQDALDRIEVFSLIASLSAMLIAGIGIASAISSYCRAKRASLACWKCLGAPRRLVFRILLLQVAGLSLLGIVPALLLGISMPYILAPLLADLLPVQLTAAASWQTILQIALGTVGLCLSFTLLPLLRASNTPALAIFRDHQSAGLTLPQTIGFAAIVMVLLFGLIATSSDVVLSFFVVLGFVLAMVIFLLLARGIIWLVKLVTPNLRSLARIAALTLTRQSDITSSTVAAVGLGLTVLFFIALTQDNLVANFDRINSTKPPDYFMLDIQPDQAEQVVGIVAANPSVAEFQSRAIVRVRITALDGVPVEQATINENARWVVRGERVVTWSKTQDYALVAGEKWSPDYKGEPLVSFTREEAEELGLAIGDTIDVNILGRSIVARITSLREVDWSSAQMNFVMVFSPGVIEKAPQTNLLSVRLNDSTMPGTLLEDVTNDFRNVSVVSVAAIVEEARRLIDSARIALEAIGFICLVAGLVVLAGQAAARHQAQIYESIIFKVCGGRLFQIISMGIFYYLLLGGAALCLALLTATLGSWGLITQFLSLEWRFNPASVAWLVLLAPAIMIATGAISGWLALRISPAKILRNE